MRQRDPQERRGLAQIHRGEPEGMEMKAACGELEVFAGEQAGSDAERAAIGRWASARETHGPREALLICRDNQRRGRLNELAREHLKARGELGEGVEIAGREWAVGDRVIARRNDRGRDLDNGMRATITHVDEQNGITIQADTGGSRQVDVDYATHHLEHAYALTGHGMQGGTVQWAAVVGQPGDFTRNWSYTALSRAREPTLILLIDEPEGVVEQRAEIAPVHGPTRKREPPQRMAARMRERDDEDLALEQLQHTETAREAVPLDAPTHAPVDIDRPGVSPLLAEIDEIGAELEAIREALKDPAIKDAQQLADVRDRIEGIHNEARVDRELSGRHDRRSRKQRVADRRRNLDELQGQERQLLERVPDPDAVLQDAEQLRDRQAQLSSRRIELLDRAIREEIDREPEWLKRTLGHEPGDRGPARTLGKDRP